MPQKPSKFTSTFPTAFQAPLPKAGAPPELSSEQKSESIFGADPFFEPRPASSNIPTRSKSKISFGDNTVPESTSSATGITSGATSRTDFNFTFGGTSDHHSSPSGYGDITGLDLPKDSTSPANIFLASTFFSAEVTDNVDRLGGSGPKMTVENKAPYNFAKSADLYVNPKAKKGAKKPLASDFFDDDPVEAEVETNTMNALAAEKIREERAPIASAGTDAAEEAHIGGSADHSATAEGSVQAGEGNATKEAEQGNSLLLPPATLSSSPPATKGAPKQPKNKSKTSHRAFLRKVAKERKRAAIGEADWL